MSFSIKYTPRFFSLFTTKSLITKIIFYLVLLLFFVAYAMGASENITSDNNLITKGDAQRCQGNLRLAIQTLTQAYEEAAPGADKGRAAAALGIALLNKRELTRAELMLREASESAEPALARAFADNDLGNLLTLRKDKKAAEKAFQRALQNGASHPALVLAVELNRLRLNVGADKLPRLIALLARLDEITAETERARYAINLANEAYLLGVGKGWLGNSIYRLSKGAFPS